MFVPTNFARLHLCNTPTPTALQTFDVHVLEQTSPEQAQLCTAGSFGAGTVCCTYVQYRAVPDTVAGSNRHSQSEINENLTKCHLRIAIALVSSGEAIFLEFPTLSKGSMVRDKARFPSGQSCRISSGCFSGRMGAGAKHPVIQLSPVLFTLAKGSCS